MKLAKKIGRENTATIHAIRTKPTLLQRIWRMDALAGMLVILFIFAFCALANLICWAMGVGQLGPVG